MLPQLSDGGNFLHMDALELQIKQRGIKVLLGTKVTEITPLGVNVVYSDGTEGSISADTVIYAVGMRALSDEAAAIAVLTPEFYMIGDCTAPKNIREATRKAFFTASNIGTI